MCVELTVHHACEDTPYIVLKCDPKHRLSIQKQQDLHCPEPAMVKWEIASDKICKRCCKFAFEYEKRLEIVHSLDALGVDDKKISRMRTLLPKQVEFWKIWKADREHFRQLGVLGGEHGELGQGQWSLRPWEEKGGFVDQNYGFDFFLGDAEGFEKPEPKGLEWLLLKLKEYKVVFGENPELLATIDEETEEEAMGSGEGAMAQEIMGKEAAEEGEGVEKESAKGGVGTEVAAEGAEKVDNGGGDEGVVNEEAGDAVEGGKVKGGAKNDNKKNNKKKNKKGKGKGKGK